MDLAAVAVPDADMPTGYELTNGSYLGPSRVRAVGTSNVPAVEAAYEATYEEHLGTAFIAVQIVAAKPGVEPSADAYIDSFDLGMLVVSSCDDQEPVTGVIRGGDHPDVPICTIAAQIGRLVVRTVWSSSDWPAGTGVQGIRTIVSQVNQRAAERARRLLAGLSIPGVEPELPSMTPRFRPVSNFENYLHRPDRFDRSDSPAPGFLCGYRRGYTEPWVVRGEQRRQIACDLLRFGSQLDVQSALANPAGLVSPWRMDHQLIPIDSRLRDCVLFGQLHASSFWSLVAFASAGDFIVTADIWGMASLDVAEGLAGGALASVRSALAAGNSDSVIDIGWD